jgi:hypothetical protein
MKSKTLLKDLVILVILQYLIDLLFVVLYASVNPARAAMIFATATLVLVAIEKKSYLNPGLGGLSIFSSALFGALLVQGGVLISKSVTSAIAHVLILVVTYILLSYLSNKRNKK